VAKVLVVAPGFFVVFFFHFGFTAPMGRFRPSSSVMTRLRAREEVSLAYIARIAHGQLGVDGEKVCVTQRLKKAQVMV
jgi:hypothetical protein